MTDSDTVVKRGWRVHFRFIERIVIFFGSLGIIVLMILVMAAIFRGEPDHSEQTEQLTRIEQKIDILTCLIVSGPERDSADIAACQQEGG